jgi:O-antigen/teichoic acid export membrane protein
MTPRDAEVTHSTRSRVRKPGRHARVNVAVEPLEPVETDEAVLTPLPPVPVVRPSVGNVGANMVATIVGNLFPPLALLITAPLLAHTLGVVGRGQVAGATAPLILVTTAATFGIPQALTYATARSPRVMRRALKSSLRIITLAGLIAMLASFLAAHWLGAKSPELPQLIIVASLAIIPGLLLTVLRGAASGLHLWRKVALEQFISSAAELVVLVALAFTHHLTPLTATLVLAFSPVTGAFAYWRIARFAPGPDDPLDPLGGRSHLLRYGSRVWVGALSGILLSRLDQTIMTPLANAYQLGLYAAAVTVSQVPLVINSAVRDVTFSADASENMDERLGASARISSTASAIVGLLVGLTMIFWLPWLFGSHFRPAISVAAILIVAVVLGTPGSIAGAGLSARGRPGLRSASLIVACIVNLVLLIVLVPHHGAIGAALATLIGNLVSANGCVYFMWRIYGVNPWQLYGLRRSDIAIVNRFARRTIAQLR